MDPAAISTNFVFKPNGSDEAPVAGSYLAADATVSLPSSQTSKHSSSIFHSHSISRPAPIHLEAKAGSSPTHSISMFEPEAANLKSAMIVTRQMTETSQKLSKGRALDMEAGSSLKVTQRSTGTACAAVSTFSGDQPGSLAGPPHQTGSEATTKDELKMGKFTSALDSVQSPAKNPQQKLTSAQNLIHASIISGTPISASGVLPQINTGMKGSTQNGVPGFTTGTAGGAPSTTEPQLNTDSNYNTPGLNGIITYADTEQDPSLQQMGDVVIGMNNMSDAPQHFEAEMFNPTLYIDLPKPTPNLDPDNCFKCKNPGDFINCSSCEKPYHLFCADLDRMPERIWECFECQSISRERLIRNLKEKQRQKAREREAKKEKDRLERENAKKQREDEQKCRREQKEQRKMAIKMQRLEQLESKKADQVASGEKINQVVIGPDGKPVNSSVLRQTTLKTEKRKRNKPEHVLTPTELEKLERSRLIKHQFQIFGQLYPEYVERNTVRYPIPDALIEKMPELHGGIMKPKPKPMKIDIDAESFERILYIWEFCNNFSEFLNTPQFKIEELQACLNYDAAKDPRMELTIVQMEELDWTEQMQLKHIREKGFHMVNHIHTALAEKYLQELFPEDQQSGTPLAISSSGETQNQILASINKLIEDKQMLWPEIIRLILIYAKNEDPDVFGPFDEQITQICAKLAGARPHTYMIQLTYQEKVTLLTVLIDCIHQTNEFRLFLNKRNDDKSTYNREKMELYQKIREIETAKEEFMKKYAENSGNKTQEQMQQELAELYAKLSSASRTESKPLKDQIVDLERQQSQYTRQLAIFDEKSKKYSATIARLNEKAFKGSIKTTMLGKDSAKSEYWHFKDDCSRIYIRMEEEVPIQVDVQMTAEQNSPSDELIIQKQSTQVESGALNRSEQRSLTEPQTTLIETGQNGAYQHFSVVEEDIPMPVSTETRYSWYFYEREDQLEGLSDSLNPKGQRERKLQENLKKIKDRLKLKKPLKFAAQKVQEGQQLLEEVSAANEEKKFEGPIKLLESGAEVTEGVDKPLQNLGKEGNVKEGSTDQVEMKDEEAEDQESITEDEIATELMQDPSLKQVIEEEESVDLTTRRVMFATDNWEDAITEAVWFGQKIPQKRRFNGRGGGNQKDPVDLFFEDNVSLQHCGGSLISIGQTYMAASSQHDREWEEEKVRETWAKNINKATQASEFLPLITQLDDGMSLPTSLCSRQGQNGEPSRIQRIKLQLFKFWPSQDMKQAWKSYLQQEGSLNQNNVNALFIALKILETACQQFSVRQAEKMERKNKQAIKQAVQPNQINFPVKQMGGLPDAQSRWQRAAIRQTIKYFESSEEEEDEDDAESGQKKGHEESHNYKSKSDADRSDLSDEPSENSSARQPSKATLRKAARNNNKKTLVAKKAVSARQTTSGPKPRRGKSRKLEDSEISSDENSDDEQSESVQDEKVNSTQIRAQVDDEEDDDQQSWDEYCYVCQDGGNVMCCEDCSQVAHYECAGLKSAPKGDWWCKDCSAKKIATTQKKQMSTRVNNGTSNVRMHSTQGKRISSASSTRQVTLTSMMPTRSSRRNGK